MGTEKDSPAANQTTRGWWWLLRWHVARWMIHTALKVAPQGHGRDRVVSALWAAGNHVRETVALSKTQQKVMHNALRRSVRIVDHDQ